MISKRILVIGVTLLLYGSTYGQSGRLRDLASRLAIDANDFAEASYRNDSNVFRNNNRTDIDAAMLAYQFAGTAQLFNRMVSDRRRNQELRDGFQTVQDVARQVERNSSRQERWYNIQRTLSDIAQELNYDSGGDNLPGPGASSGRMTWKGKVDDDIRITIRGGRADVETLGGTPYYDATTNFSAALPPRRVNVRLIVKKGRGQVSIEQQPSRVNDFSAVIRIRDPKGGASDYELEIAW